MIHPRCEFEHVDRKFDVHVALDATATVRVGELARRLGDERVAVVDEPIGERPERRVFLAVEKGCGIVCPQHVRPAPEELEQASVVDVKTEVTGCRIEARAVDEQADAFVRNEKHDLRASRARLFLSASRPEPLAFLKFLSA